MLSVVGFVWSKIGSKGVAILLTALTLVTALGIVIARIAGMARTEARAKQMEATINDYKTAAKAQAEVDAMSDAAVSERLLKRWQRK